MPISSFSVSSPVRTATTISVLSDDVRDFPEIVFKIAGTVVAARGNNSIQSAEIFIGKGDPFSNIGINDR